MTQPENIKEIIKAKNLLEKDNKKMPKKELDTVLRKLEEAQDNNEMYLINPNL